MIVSDQLVRGKSSPLLDRKIDAESYLDRTNNSRRFQYNGLEEARWTLELLINTKKKDE